MSPVPPGQLDATGCVAGVEARSTVPWAVILAGGEGMRLQPLTRHITGDERPKQFCDLTGRGTLLQETARRVARLIPPERQLVSLTHEHAPFFEPILPLCGAVRPVVQPENRGTVLGLLYPALHVARLDSSATLAVFPSDHFITPPEPFMDAVASAAAVVEVETELVVLLGIRPSSPETEYGWIEPGPLLGLAPGGVVQRVSRFVEKPAAPRAHELWRAGWLWNTLVLVGKAMRLIELGRAYVPAAVEPLLEIRHGLGTAGERELVARAYARAPAANLSRDLLERAQEGLGVIEVSGVTWSDWGTPGRVVATLSRLGEQPTWMGRAVRKGLARAAGAPGAAARHPHEVGGSSGA